MKINFRFIAFFILSTAISVAPMTIACTIFTAQNGDVVMFGGNEDNFYPKSSFLVVDNFGTLGVVYFAVPWEEWSWLMEMGINEKGLCFDTNWIPEEKLNPHPERKAQDRWAVIELMREASTVEDVLSNIFTYNWANSISYQIHFADKFGDAVVIHPGQDGELTYTRKPKENGFLVSTNFNLAQLNNGSWSCNRYEIAIKMLANIGSQFDLTVEFMTSVLEATHQDNISIKTLYSAVYDLKSLRIYLFYDRRFGEPFVLDVKKELAETNKYKRVPLKDLIAGRN